MGRAWAEEEVLEFFTLSDLINDQVYSSLIGPFRSSTSSGLIGSFSGTSAGATLGRLYIARL